MLEVNGVGCEGGEWLVLSNEGVEHYGSRNEVAARLCRPAGESLMVATPSVPEVVGRRIEEQGGSYLELTSGDRTGRVRQRTTDSPLGVTVCKKYAPRLDIVAHIEPANSTLLDRGLAWVRITPETPELPAGPGLLIMWIKPQRRVETFRITGIMTRTTELIEGILRSDQLPPYALPVTVKKPPFTRN